MANDCTSLPEVLDELARLLNHTHQKVATAESCTGGLLAGALTSIPGSSNWYEGGFVTYRLSAKTRLLDIDAEVLRSSGAVSQIVAEQMADRTLTHCDAQVSVATTGLAGPDGDGTATAVGTLWIAWAGQAGTRPDKPGAWVESRCFMLSKARQAFREEATLLAAHGLLARLLSSA